MDQFIEWHVRRVTRRTGRPPAKGTIRTKASRLRVCMAVAGLADPVDLGTLLQDRERVECLLDGLAARMTPGSMQAAVDALKDFGAYAQARGWCSAPALLPGDRPGSNPQKPIAVYTPDELGRLTSGARGVELRWWAFVVSLVDTGRRVGELLALEWAWLNLWADPPHFHLPTSKNGKQQYVPLTRRLATEVFTVENVELLQREKRVGRNRQFGRDPQLHIFPFTYTAAERRFQRFCDTVGVEHRGLHAIRHTFATALLARGVPLQAVSALVGHSSSATTDRIYNHATALNFARYLEGGSDD